MNIFNKILKLLAVSIIVFSLVACGNEKSKKEEDKNITNIEQDKDNYDETKIYEINGIQSKDSGITQTIKEVGVFSNMSSASKKYAICNKFINDKDKDKTTVVVKFEIKNENNFTISAYSSVKPFVTNTSEVANSIKGDTYKSDINANKTDEGYAVFTLNKTKVDELKSLNMWWIIGHENGTENNDDDYCKDNKFYINLE